MQRKAVGIIAGHDGYIGLNGVGQHVQAGVGHDALGHRAGELRVDDGHVRRQAVVGQGYLMLPFCLSVMTEKLVTSEPVPEVVGMATSLAFWPSLGNLNARLRMSRKQLAQAVEAGVRMLVEQPHALGRVDGRAAADGDDDVRLEGVHGLDAAHDALNGRVGFPRRSRSRCGSIPRALRR